MKNGLPNGGTDGKGMVTRDVGDAIFLRILVLYAFATDICFKYRHSFHINDAPDAVARSHRAEAFVDLLQCLAVRDELVDFQFAVFVVLDEAAHL